MYVAPTNQPQMASSSQPQMSGLSQPQMAPARKFGPTAAVHFQAIAPLHGALAVAMFLNAPVPLPSAEPLPSDDIDAPKLEPLLRAGHIDLYDTSR